MASDPVTVSRSTLERCRALVEAVQGRVSKHTQIHHHVMGDDFKMQPVKVTVRSLVVTGPLGAALDDADALLLSDLDAALQP